MIVNGKLVGKENSGKCILNTYFKIQKTFVFLKVFLKKCFYGNDAGSLKLTVSFSEVYSNLFLYLRNLKILSWTNTFQPFLLSASYLSYLSSFVEWILYLILLLEIQLKIKIYVFIYALCNAYILSSFSSLLFYVTVN